MADKVVLEAEIKSNIKAVSQDTKELTNNFGAFGITIGGIKDKFKDVAKIMNNGLKQVILQAKLADPYECLFDLTGSGYMNQQQHVPRAATT